MTTGPATASPTRTPTSLVDLEYRRKVLLVGVLVITLFVTAMNQSIVATASQNIVADIGGFALFPWLFTGFSLVSAIAVPIVGKLNDLLGPKPVILSFLVVFLVATLLCGLSLNMPQLVAARALQGLGFAGVLGSNWIIMAALWPRQDRAKWLGVMSAGFTASGVVGPIVGGVVSDAWSWRWVFFLNVPIGILALYLLATKFPRVGKSSRRPRFDFAGAIAFGISSGAGLFAISTGGDLFPWTSPLIIALFIVSGVSLAAFIWIERKAADPLLPLDLFSHRVFSSAMAGSLTVTISFVVTTVFMPFFVIGAMGRTATQSALPLMTMAVGVAVGANLFGQILSRLGYPREVAMIGMATSASVLWWLSTLDPNVPMAKLSAMTFLLGFGISGVFTAYTAPVQNAMPNSVLGVVTSNLQFARVFGMALGAALLGAIMLANLGIIGVEAETPQQQIRDPEVVVSETRLGQVEEAYIDNPALGQEQFVRDLAASRQNISSALSLVFKVAAFASAAGLVTAVLAFTGNYAARQEESAEAT